MTITSTNGTSPPATSTPAERYVACEAIIERGLEAFLDVGHALVEIKVGDLYKLDGYKTFEDYCQRRWNISRPHGYRLVEAAKLAEAMSPIGDIPATESQARALAPLKAEPAKAVKALAAAKKTADGKRPTAKQIAAEVAKVVPPKAPAKPKKSDLANDFFGDVQRLVADYKKATGRPCHADIALAAGSMLGPTGPALIGMAISHTTDSPEIFEQIIAAARVEHTKRQQMLTLLGPTLRTQRTNTNTNTNTKKKATS